MNGVGITYLWTSREFPQFVRLEGKRGDYEVYWPERTCEFKPFKGPISDLDEDGDRKGVCSECNAYMHEQFLYCPNCGSKVIGGDE